MLEHFDPYKKQGRLKLKQAFANIPHSMLSKSTKKRKYMENIFCYLLVLEPHFDKTINHPSVYTNYFEVH